MSNYEARTCQQCGDTWVRRRQRGRPPSRCPDCQQEASTPKPRKNLRWAPIVERAAEIVRSYDTQVTLRQLYYRLISEGLIPNEQNKYNTLANRTAEARRDGCFPDLIDRGRKIHRAPSWDAPDDALTGVTRYYRRDRTEGQPYTVVLGVEKAGLVVQMESWFGQYGVPIVALGGYASTPYIADVMDYVNRYDRPAVFLYAGDLDATGVDIYRHFRERTPGRWHHAERIGLTVEQMERHNLVKMPGKPDDTRAEAFIAEYGELFQVELDALAPEDLRSVFDAEFARFWVMQAYDDIRAQEADDLETLRLAAELVKS